MLINSYSEQFTAEQIRKMLALTRKWDWISYLALPIILYLKVTLITMSLSIATFFLEREQKFTQIFSIVVGAEFVFLIPQVLKIIHFGFLEKDYTIRDMQMYSPLSFLSLISHDDLTSWEVFLASTLNIFELIYWIVLVFSVARLCVISKEKALYAVAGSYGFILLIWTVVLAFFTSN